MKKFTVSIGISAYNEEANIKSLLSSILAQKCVGFKILKIVVLSDGSNDRTIMFAKSIDSNLIKVIDGKKRIGKVARQNEILKLTNSDVLVLLDADILPENDLMLKNLVKPILEGKADLVSGRIKPLDSSNVFENVINFSVNVKNSLFEKVSEVNGVYLCHGRVRAFSKKLYQKLIWPKSVNSGEDAYSYFFCITKGYKFSYQKQAKVLYRSPNTLNDHTKQSIRFIQSKRSMKNYFDKDVVNKAYKVDLKVLIRNIFYNLITNPILLCVYLFIYFLSFLLSFVKHQNNQFWEISSSSKKLA